MKPLATLAAPVLGLSFLLPLVVWALAFQGSPPALLGFLATAFIGVPSVIALALVQRGRRPVRGYLIYLLIITAASGFITFLFVFFVVTAIGVGGITYLMLRWIE